MSEPITSYSVDNDRRFRKAMEDASKVSQDLRVPFGLILRDFYKSQQAIFKLKSAGQYPEISDSYGPLKQKAVGFKYPLLVRTGKLSASTLGPNNPGSVAQIGKLSLIFGSTIKYGIFHQLGTKHMPMRKFIFIGPEARKFANKDQVGRLQRWEGYIMDHIRAKIAKGA